MPNIKPEQTKKFSSFLHSTNGEALTVALTGALSWAIGAAVVGYALRYLSTLIYPFSYMLLHSPIHTFLPRAVSYPSFLANLLFGAAFASAVYYFEKNIFYRRFHISVKALFAAVAGCVFVFVTGLISHAGFLPFLFHYTDALELPWLFLYYYMMSLPVFALCNLIRREIFLFP